MEKEKLVFASFCCRLHADYKAEDEAQTDRPITGC